MAYGCNRQTIRFWGLIQCYKLKTILKAVDVNKLASI